MESSEDDDELVELPDDQQMTTISRHQFGEGSNSTDAFYVTVIENMKEEYGLFVWPCSIILAEYVWQQRSRFSGANVVELGAGTSLPGLLAAKLGADVTLTDDSSRPEVLANMRRLCDLNNVKCEVLGLTWGVWDAPIFSLRPDIILGADVLYDANAFEDLFATLTFLLQSSPSSVFVTAYHNRRYYWTFISSYLLALEYYAAAFLDNDHLYYFVFAIKSGHHLIEFLMVKWGLKCVKLLDGFSVLPADKVSGLSGNIQLAEIVLDNKLN